MFRHIRISYIILFVLIILNVVEGARFAAVALRNTDKPERDEEIVSVKEVSVAVVRDISNARKPLPAVGEVTSRSEALVRAEAAGRVVRVYTEEGRRISRGVVIAEIESSAQRAAVRQAEALVALRRASLEKTEKGTREEQLSILAAKRDSAEDLLAEAQHSAVSTLQNTFVTADDAIHNKVDQFFIDPRSRDPRIQFIGIDYALKLELEWQRFLIEDMLTSWQGSLDALKPSDDLFVNIEIAEDNLNEIREFLDDASIAINRLTAHEDLSATTITTWQTNVLAARTGINAAITTVSALTDTLNSKTTAAEVAATEYAQALAGERTEDISGSEASLEQALAALDGAEVNLEKTIIRSPLSGTINTLDIEAGDFVSLLENVAVVSDNTSLEVISFITPEDRAEISVGAEVLISGNGTGSITDIAPALTAATRKIKITIGVERDAALANGASVALSITRTPEEGAMRTLAIPVSAVKVLPDRTAVFGVDESSRLVAFPVVLGSLVGQRVIVTEGITPEQEIVLDARGLKAGEEVIAVRK